MFPLRGSADSDRFWEGALQVYSRKLEIIASNIANADTPHYKARDIDFSSALSQAMSRSELGASQVRQNKSLNDDFFPLLYRAQAQGSVDGNTVDMDVERSAFADASIRYELAIQQVAHEYKSMSELLSNLPY
jgi:flagellar basal-body rod protein FlgB